MNVTQNSNSQFPVLAGTEGTKQYVTLLVTVLGILALRRAVGQGVYRLRIEPSNANAAKKLAKVLTRDKGWKQPGDNGQNRFSNICSLSDDSALEGLVETAVAALTLDGAVQYMNPDAPDLLALRLWKTAVHLDKGFVVQHPAEEHKALVETVKGANSRWGLTVLRAKAAAQVPVPAANF